MRPGKTDVDRLLEYLRWLHGPKLEELEEKGKALAEYLERVRGFALIDAKQPYEHIGRVIVDWVLQVGKNYETHVRPAVDRIKTFPGAATVSGFTRLLNERKLKELTNMYESKKVKYDLLRVANFFADKEIDTFKQLFDWLKFDNWG
jgi:hypothetical protein